MIADKNRTANIMVVDDTIANLKLLEGILGRKGYRVRSFPRGRLALASAAVEPPDLILLDINIPEMNGYEMCAKLKANPALAGIPVIFISALNETLDKTKAFGCGGVDYINKPFQIEEILARVENHVSIRRLQMQLDQHTARLDESVRLKTCQLAETNERLLILDQAKNEFIRLVSQELRTPPNAVNGELVEAFRQSQQRWLQIMEDALLLTETHAQPGPATRSLVPLSAVVRHAAHLVADQARHREVVLPSVPETWPAVNGHARLIQRALLAVLETAVKFSSPGHILGISCEEQADDVLVVLTSAGQAIPEDALALLFQAPAAGGSSETSLALAQRLLLLFGGGIAVENAALAGVKWTVRFKRVPSAETTGKACA